MYGLVRLCHTRVFWRVYHPDLQLAAAGKQRSLYTVTKAWLLHLRLIQLAVAEKQRSLYTVTNAWLLHPRLIQLAAAEKQRSITMWANTGQYASQGVRCLLPDTWEQLLDLAAARVDLPAVT